MSSLHTYRFSVGIEQQDMRLDAYLAEETTNLSRSYLQKLIKEGQVQINGITIVKPSTAVCEGDEIVCELPESSEPEIVAEDLPLEVLYEDEDLLVVNKPKGMVVHPSAGHPNGTLVNAVMYHCKGNLSGINGVMRPGIVHRIDMDTSGSLIICKNDMAHNSIAAQLKDHSIKRLYHAIVFGHLKDAEGTIDAPIGRDPKNRLRNAIVPNGKHAVTHYRVLEELNGFSYIECRLETGRTHQIRVHMASIHHPLLGDELYAGGFQSHLHTDGQVLHAKTIGFVHPRSGAYVEIDTELPAYFNKLLQVLRK